MVEGKTVLVTGGATGIGFAIAARFLRSGARVMVDAPSQEQLDAALPRLREISEQVAGYPADVRRLDEVESLIDATLARFGRLDVLVNNAGIYPSQLVLDMSEAEWDEVLETNLKGPFLVSKLAARAMVDQGEGGSIIAISSATYDSTRIGAAHYAASKAGVVALTKTLALELAPYGIRANVVAPGLIELPGKRRRGNPDYVQAFLGATPLGRLGVPDEIAAAVVFLASDDASYITGQVLTVDGGVQAGRYYLPMNRKPGPEGIAE